MRKPRSDSKLLNLPEERRGEILDLLESGLGYKEVRAQVAREFGVQSSERALSHFYSVEKSKRVIAQRLKSLAVANAVSEEAKARPSMFSGAMIEQISQLAFELSIQANADPDVVKQFFDMVLKAREQELKSRSLALLEEKARKADEAGQTMNDSQLSPEQKQTRLKQIFGAS